MTVEELSRRAPAIIAAAASQLEDIVLGLHFGDSSHAELRAQHSCLFAQPNLSEQPTVEAYFDDRSFNLLFDLENQPVEQLWIESLDVRGNRDQVLSVWRVFRLLSQRASGLRAIQNIWQQYRANRSHLWGVPASGGQVPISTASIQPPRTTGWSALDYLDHRYPKDIDAVQSTLGNTVYVDSRTLWNGQTSFPWWELTDVIDADLMETLQGCKHRVKQEILRLVPNREPRPYLYDQIREYPSREGKGLRPTLTIATCCAFGGRPEDAVRSAAAIEMFHNGFLVHDDIADESTHRRNEATLHMEHGIGMAVNTGDAMNLLAIDAVLSNLPTLGLARTLGLIHEVMHMCRETIEGQAIELGWIRNYIVPTPDEDYFNMSTKKTGWYTCISPCRIGAICAGETNPQILDCFNEVFRLVGIAFQIQDDVLNLIGEQELYGKEPLGDLLEGKRTVMMIHLMRNATETVRERMMDIIRLPRVEKTQQDAEEMLAVMHQHGSIEYAIELANQLAHNGVRCFETDLAFLPESEAKAVLRQIANYVTTRPL